MSRMPKMKKYSMMTVLNAPGNVSIYEKYPYWIYLKVGECKGEFGDEYRMCITIKFITQANKNKKIKIYYYSKDLNQINTMSEMVFDRVYRIMTNDFTEKDRNRNYLDLYLEIYYYEARTNIVTKTIMGTWELRNQIKLQYLDLYLLQ